MKKIFLLFILLINIYAQDLSIGLGAYMQTQPYKDTDSIIVPSPVIFYDNGFIYARWSRFGVYFLGDKQKDFSWGLSLTAQPRPNGYKSDDSIYLKGLKDKKSSLEGGLAFSAFSKNRYIEAMILYDMLGRYKSYIAKIEAGYKYKKGKFTFYPSIIGVYESKSFTNYYYGISNEESILSNYHPYSPSGGLRVGIQSYINYHIYKNYSAFFNIRADRLSNSAKNSPIVDDSFVYSGLISLLYTFGK
jgi:outer membrane protein